MFNPTEFSVFQWLLMPLFIFGRYVVPAGIFFLIFYVWKRQVWIHFKIQPKFPAMSDYQREIGFSALTSLIFGVVAWLCLGTSFHHYTWFYTDIYQYGLGWLFASVPIALLVHDAYFYWIHRLMHHPAAYRMIHLTHHRSVNPSPWAAFAFHPLEAVAEAGIIPLLLLIMPLHPVSFLAFVSFMTVFNIYGHLGYELFPKNLYRHPLGKWLNSSVYHNLHHEKFHGNYGLYFTIWDRLCGTMRPDNGEKISNVHQGISNAQGSVRIDTRKCETPRPLH